MMKFKGKIAVVTGGAQQPAGRVGNPLDIANMVLFLCSHKAGFITGKTSASAAVWPGR